MSVTYVKLEDRKLLWNLSKLLIAKLLQEKEQQK